MNKFVAVLVLSLALCATLSSQPKIKFTGGPMLDFGEMYNGDTLTRKVTVRNDGVDTLKIAEVKPSCGCTAALVSSPRIAPHDSTALTIAFHSGAYLGKVTKSVTLVSNDTTTPNLGVNFVVTVKSVLSMNPRFIYFGNVKVDTTLSKSVRLKNVTAETITILQVSAKDSQLTSVKIVQKTLKPDEETDLTATLNPRQTGYLQGDIQIRTDFKPYPNLTLSYNAQSTKVVLPPVNLLKKK